MGIRDGFKRDFRGIQGDDEKGFFSNSLLGKDRRFSHLGFKEFKRYSKEI